MTGHGIVNTVLGLAMFGLVLAALRPVTDREVRVFSERYGLEDTSGTTVTLSTTLRRVRASRLLGAAIGFSVPVLLRAATGDRLPTGSSIVWAGGGYLAGALAAVLAQRRLSSPSPRAAALVLRRARDYLPRLALIWPPVTAFVAALAVMLDAVGPRQPTARSAASLIALLVVSVIAALVSAASARAVVRHRQPVSDPELVAVDDALRAHTLQIVAATGIAIGAVACDGILIRFAADSSLQPVQWILPWLGLGELVVAGIAWFGLRGWSWQVIHTSQQ